MDPNLIFVTGGVVSDQTGQLDLNTHLSIIMQTYSLIAETFPNSFVIPTLGSSDYYPQHYTNLNLNRVYSAHDWNRTDRYKRDNQDFMSYVRTIFNNDLLRFEDSSGMSQWGDFTLLKVPYFSSTDSDTEEVTTLYLPNTWLYSINTQGCNQKNLALYETFGDPGNGLWQFEQVLA